MQEFTLDVRSIARLRIKVTVVVLDFGASEPVSSASFDNVAEAKVGIIEPVMEDIPSAPR